jgi:methylglutamate dehydrogenase subunit D
MAEIVLDARSPLEGVTPLKHDTLRLFEAQDYSLTQVAGDAKVLKTAFPKLPQGVGVAIDYAGKTLFRVGPDQLWIVGTPPERHVGLFFTPLTSSRTRLCIEGQRARDVLSKSAMIDFHSKVFTPGRFVMTGIHHMPVMIHCVDANIFHLYIMRTFALHLWEILTDAAHS